MAKVNGYLKMILAVFIFMIASGLGLGGYSLFSQGDISLSEFCAIAIFSIGCFVLSFRFGQASRRCFREWQQIEEQRRRNGLPPASLSNLLNNYYQNADQDELQQIAEMEAVWWDD